MPPYFWDPPGRKLGLKADIKRHREAQAKLDARIAELEAVKERDYFQEMILRTYRHIRAQLLQSRADTVDKLGRKP